MKRAKVPTSLQFFAQLRWLDGRPLLATIEPYRRAIFSAALDTVDDDGLPKINLVLAGRGKKNWKSADLVLAALHCLLMRESEQGSDAIIIANDEDQARDDLSLAKKLIRINPDLAAELEVYASEIRRKDGRGSLKALPAGDALGAHGKTAVFVGIDEAHGYKNWDVLEGLQPDPTRRDVLTWVTSYDELVTAAHGSPLHDLKALGMSGTDPRMLFSWYSGDYCTDPDFSSRPPEERANPSMTSWAEGRAYLDQQRRRLPTHKYRRLHLNLPGAASGAFLSPDHVARAVLRGRPEIQTRIKTKHFAFVDMSGGSNDDAALAVAHVDSGRVIVNLAIHQSAAVPFNPRFAITQFAEVLRRYGIVSVVGDAYGGETFRQDFLTHGINYVNAKLTASEYYESLEPRLNAQEVVLPDVPKLEHQLLNLVVKGLRVTHPPAAHDDLANAVAGAIHVATVSMSNQTTGWGTIDVNGHVHLHEPQMTTLDATKDFCFETRVADDAEMISRRDEAVAYVLARAKFQRNKEKRQ